MSSLLYYAEVELEIIADSNDLKIIDNFTGEGWQRQGCTENVTANGYDAWKAGAWSGIFYAMKRSLIFSS